MVVLNVAGNCNCITKRFFNDSGFYEFSIHISITINVSMILLMKCFHIT